MGDKGRLDEQVAGNVTYGFQERLKAFVLFMDGQNYDRIAAQLGCSSRIVAKWSSDGYVTDGERWHEVRERIAPLRAAAKTGAKRQHKTARKVEEMEYKLDRLFHMASDAIEDQAADPDGGLRVQIDDVAKLARARMQVQEFYQREYLAFKKAQERLAEVLLRQKIDRDTLLKIADDVDRVFKDIAEEADVEIEELESFTQTRTLLAP